MTTSEQDKARRRARLEAQTRRAELLGVVRPKGSTLRHKTRALAGTIADPALLLAIDLAGPGAAATVLRMRRAEALFRGRA